MAAKKTEAPVTEEVMETNEIVEKETRAKKPKPKFEETDLIPCVSITVGGLYMVGPKSKDLYEWLSIGDTVDVEYRDLVSAIRARDGLVYRPRFIIDDEEFLEAYPDVRDVYRGLYNTEMLTKILSMPPNRMKKAIEDLPPGAKDAIKGLAATMINNGTLDSVQRIKILDEMFGTEMLLSLAR